MNTKRARFSVPKAQIKHHMGNVHVGKSDEFVTEMFTQACERTAGITASQTKRIVAYAIACHRENQNLYHCVMTGRF